MKVSIVNPPHFKRGDRLETFFAPPPIGLAYLASYLENHGIEAKVIDAYGEKPHNYSAYEINNFQAYINGLQIDEIIAKIPVDSRIIGISCMFTSLWFFHKEVISEIQNAFPNATILIGGEHATAEYESILKSPGLSNILCVLGEGEDTLLEVCNVIKYSIQPDWSKVKGLAFIDQKGNLQHSRRDRIKNIDELPLPAWHLLPVENYIPNGVSVLNKRTLPVITSRGCPYRCKFCSAPTTWGTQTFLRSPDRIVKEMSLFKEKYNIEHFDFMDLVGSFNKKWTLQFCDELIKSGLNTTMVYAPGTRSEVLTEEVLAKMKEAGFVKILYAADSTSSEESRRILKNVNFKKMLKSIRTCVKQGIVCRVVLMVGTPGMKKRELLKGIIFAYKAVLAGVNDVPVNNFVPYSGTEFYDTLKARGQKLNIERNSNSFLGFVQSYSEHIPSWLLSLYRDYLVISCVLLQYTIRPWRIFQTLNRLLRHQPLTATENVLYQKMMQIKSNRSSSKNSEPLFE